MRMFLAVAAASLAMSLSAEASASVVFDNNPGQAYSGGNNPMAQGYYVAQNFVLSSAYDLTKFTYNAYTRPNTLAVTSANINIYSDNSGLVDSLLYSGSFAPASTAVTGTDGYWTFEDFSFDLPSWSLNAGSYFVGLNVLPSQYDMHWTIPATPALPGGNFISSTGAPGTFGSYAWDHDFTLNGDAPGAVNGAVPEPTTWALMLVGFGAIGASMRRKQRQTVRYSFA